MKNYKYRENKIYCGDFLDVEIYPVFKKARARREKFQPTSSIQKRLNATRAQKKLERLLHTNFTCSDYALHLTYDNDCIPTGAEEAQKDIQNFLRRARRYYKKQGIELKYICVTEKGARSNRIHHHLVLSGEVDRSELEALWDKGYANSKKLRFTKNGLAGLSNYITKQPLLFKRWTSSRNLKKPTERKNDYRYNVKQARNLSEGFETERSIEKLYSGYFLSEIDADYNEVNGGYYIRLRLYRNTIKVLS